MQTLRSIDTPKTPPDPPRGGAHRAPVRQARWWIASVLCAGVLAGAGTGIGLAEMSDTAGQKSQEQSRTGVDVGEATAQAMPEAGLITQEPEPSSPEPEDDSPSETDSSEPEPDEPDDPVGGEFSEFITEAVKLTNVERAANGCGEVVVDDRLVAAATGHSQDMADNNYFDHVSQDGSTFSDRASAQGYGSAISENIAAGQTTAEQVMDSWMNSQGHRDNILNCDAKAIGLGVAEGGDGTKYWTQMFGSE